MFYYIARQPILDVNKKLIAYELLFRNGTDNAFPKIHEDKATASLIENNQLLHKITDITHGALAFINFSEEALFNELPFLLPKESIVIEILETVRPSDSLYHKLLLFKQRGYTLALDDFNFDPAWQKILPLVNIIKVDLNLSSLKQIETLIKQIKQYDIQLLAEKVESHQQFQACLKLGFQYFQGYFFAKPEVLIKRSLTTNQASYIQLLRLCNQPEFNFDKIQKVISHDVGLSYKLLRYVNSPIYSVNKRIDSLHQALIYLGEKEVKKFITLLAAAQINTSKPTELMRLSTIRGYMCEALAQHAQVEIATDKAFLTGVFSVLDAILDESMEKILDRIQLADDVKQALVQRVGPLAYCLALTIFYEAAQWDKVQKLATFLGISDDLIPICYRQAVSSVQYTES